MPSVYVIKGTRNDARIERLRFTMNHLTEDGLCSFTKEPCADYPRCRINDCDGHTIHKEVI